MQETVALRPPRDRQRNGPANRGRLIGSDRDEYPIPPKRESRLSLSFRREGRAGGHRRSVRSAPITINDGFPGSFIAGSRRTALFSSSPRESESDRAAAPRRNRARARNPPRGSPDGWRRPRPPAPGRRPRAPSHPRRRRVPSRDRLRPRLRERRVRGRGLPGTRLSVRGRVRGSSSGWGPWSSPVPYRSIRCERSRTNSDTSSTRLAHGYGHDRRPQPARHRPRRHGARSLAADLTGRGRPPRTGPTERRPHRPSYYVSPAVSRGTTERRNFPEPSTNATRSPARPKRGPPQDRCDRTHAMYKGDI